MAIKIQFDKAYNPIQPTLVLAKRNGDKLGVIDATNVNVIDNFNEASELSFTVYKELCPLWDEIKDFRLCWCKEWDMWFEMDVSTSEESAVKKDVQCKALGEVELSQINLHDLEINTEDDIDRPDYNENEPHVFYDERYPQNSILCRVLSKAPHYTIEHVDYSVGSLYGVFTFDDTSILDALNELSEEFDCLIVINANSKEDGSINRSVSVYDLETLCLDCGHRGVFTDTCEDCGSHDLKYGYGDDTTIFINRENLASNITFEVDNDSVKNCFRLEAGDDLMTDTIIEANPNGSQYIWFITDEMKADMSAELVAKLEEYDESYRYYLNDHEIELPSELVADYNALVTKYTQYNEDLTEVSGDVIGYEELMDLEYDVIDFYLFLKTSLMPAPEMMNTTAVEQAGLLNQNTLGTIAVSNLATCSRPTASNVVANVAKAIVDPRYSAKVKDDSYDAENHIWTGVVTVKNYSNEDDVADSIQLTVTVNDDEATQVRQQIARAMDKKIGETKADSAYDCKALFSLSLEDFTEELKKYGVDSLSMLDQVSQVCLDVMQEQGSSNDSDWNHDIYTQLYVPYSDKQLAVQSELALRESEVSIIVEMQSVVVERKDEIRSALNMEACLGTDLWKEFISFCREDEYQNENYISDGLNNAELFAQARNFIRIAKKDLYKSSMLQHSITANIGNLLVMEEFQPLVEHFQLGNWLRVRLDDEIYLLRLVSYSVNFDDPSSLEVEFSDVYKVPTGISDIESILDRANTIATSYQYIERQASAGDEANKQITNWFERGLDATLSRIVNNASDQTMVFDDHGLLMRRFDIEEDDYAAEQLKIINSTIAITDDNWRSTKTAVGKFYYFDVPTNTMKKAFGVNGETIVGKIFIGEGLGLYNTAGTMEFNENGLMITNDTNTFTVDPNSTTLLSLSHGEESLISVNEDGDLTVSGDVVAHTLSTGGRLNESTGQSGTFIDEYGNIYSGRGNEFMVTSEGKLYATDAEISGEVHASSGTFTGAISGSTISAGNKTDKDTPRLGLFIDSDGSVYAGVNNETTIRPDGTFQFGGANGLTFDGSVLSLNGKITATSLSTGTKTAADTGTGTYIDANGAIYSGVDADNTFTVTSAGKLTASGATINGALTATTLATGTRTSKTAGVGAFIDAEGAIYSGENSQYKFTVTKDGKLTATEATIKGALTATTLAAGLKTSADSRQSGTFIDSDGAIYVGSANKFTVDKFGVVTATDGNFTGNVHAKTLSSGTKTSASSSGSGCYIDSNGAIYSGANNSFTVSSAGVLTATGANISGTINASSGSFTGAVYASSGSFTGTVHATDGDFTGTVNATDGSFKGNITALTLSTGEKTGEDVRKAGTYIDAEGAIYSGARNTFTVTKDGVLSATGATISGSITATSLTLGQGVTIDSDDVTGLAAVATTGSYDSLSDKPFIPDELSDLEGYQNILYKGDISFSTSTSNGIVTTTATWKDSSGTTQTSKTYTSSDGSYVLTDVGKGYVNSSGDVVEGHDGFILSSNGLLQASNAIIYGQINANSGQIGGWTIANNQLYSGTKDGTSSGDIKLSTVNFSRYIGNSTRYYLRIAVGSNFGVASDGTVYAGNGVFNGTVNATSGSFTGSVTASSLSTGNKSSSSSGTGIYIDSSGNLYAGSGSSNGVVINSSGYFTFGGSNGISYSSGNKLYLGSSAYINLNNGRFVIGDKELYNYDGGLYEDGNFIASGTIRSASTIYVGSSSSNPAVKLTSSGDITCTKDITANGTVYGGTLYAYEYYSGWGYRRVATQKWIENEGYLKDTGKFAGTVKTLEGSYYYSPVGSNASYKVSYLATESPDILVVHGSYGTGSSFSAKRFQASSSDERLKTNIEDSDYNAISTIRQMVPRKFDWKESMKHEEVGYVAQELEKIDPGLVIPPSDLDDYYSLSINHLCIVTSKAVKELVDEIDTLKARVAELEAKQ